VISDTEKRAVEVVTALVRIARPVLLEQFSRDSCIAATRIGIDVLEYFGVQAIPVPVGLMIFNGEATKLISQGLPTPEIRRLMLERSADEPGGPWSVLVGADLNRPQGWAGHLVIGVPSIRTVADLSLDQASRPHKQMDLEPTAYVIPDDAWWLGNEPRYLMRATNPKTGDEVTVMLDAALDPEGFKRSRNWLRGIGDRVGTAVFREVTGKIIRLMKDELRTEASS